MWPLARPYAGRILLCLCLVLAGAGLQLMLPLGIRYLFDRALQGSMAETLHWMALLLVLLFLGRSLLGFFGQFLLQVTGDRVIVALRASLFEHLQKLGLDFHHRTRVGDLLSRLSNDVAAIRNVVTNLSVSVIVSLSLLVGAATVMLLMDLRLGLVVLGVAPLATVTSRAFGPLFQRLSARIQDELAQSNVIAQESLSGIEVTQGFARSAHESGRYRQGLDRFMQVVIRARRVDAFFNALVGFLTSMATIAIFWYGGLQVMGGQLTAGTLVAFLLYSQNVTQSIAGLAQHYATFRQSMGASARVFEILEQVPSVSDRADAVALQGRALDIEFEAVRFGYDPALPVLHGLSLQVRCGETLALSGASGAGKSTVLKLISRLFDPQSGCIRIQGRDIRDYRLDSLRAAIAVVGQDVFLFGGSVRENIRYGRLDASDAEIEQAARDANAHDFIESLPQGYETAVGDRGVQLSGGQRQRIAIARALLKDAPILLLDEATSAVDPASEQQIQEALDRLRRHRTTVVVAHREATLQTADRVLRIEDGAVLEGPDTESTVAVAPGASGHGPRSGAPSVSTTAALMRPASVTP